MDPKVTSSESNNDSNKKEQPSKKSLIKDADLPTEGKIRYVPPKDWKPAQGLPEKRLPGGKTGYRDRFDNVWVKGPSRTAGQLNEWDVQLSNQGRAQIGWTTRDGSHANVSLDGRITHK